MPKISESNRFHSSELSRNSARVLDAAQDHPVKVTRRGGESLILMSEREAIIRQKLLEIAADLIAVTTDDRGTLTQRMADRFPWMLALNERDRTICADELVSSARASFATNQPHLAVATLTSWKETAEAFAAGLVESPVDWLSDDEEVERP